VKRSETLENPNKSRLFSFALSAVLDEMLDVLLADSVGAVRGFQTRFDS
jgi:hypothetical protein